jgi:hypothetical protein
VLYRAGARREGGDVDSARYIIVGVLVSAALACGGPLPAADVPTQVSSTDGLDAATAGDASGGVFHTITVTLCSRDRDACRKAQGAPGEVSYRIAFGASAGTLRTREQTTADLYRELRDRTAFGTHLAAERRRLPLPGEDAGGLAPAASIAGAPALGPASADKDVLVDAARELVEAVDADGEVTIDVARGRPGCKVSLTLAASPGLEASAGRCLIRDERRPGAHEDEPARGHEERFGK